MPDDNTDNLEIEHSRGTTKVFGVPEAEVKTLWKSAKNSGAGTLAFSGIKKIERCRNDGTPHQTIFTDAGRGEQ